MDGRLSNRVLRLSGIAFFMIATLIGCVGRGNTELLESQLRLRDEQLAEARRHKDATDRRLVAIERERDLLASRSADNNPILPEQARAASAVENIEVQRLLSGLVDTQSAGKAVKLVVSPVDADGEVIRVVGEFRVEAVRAPPADDDDSEAIELVAHQESNLGSWKFTNRDADNLWRTGFARGYHLRLPVHPEAATVPLKFTVKFTSIDGREFETTAVIAPPSERRIAN